jgi:nicotinamide phosphoribosyltransferase
MEEASFSASNIAFGMGGALLQKCDRDTYSFAQKACEIVRSGTAYDTYKQPFTDSKKSSKHGRQSVTMKGGKYITAPEKDGKTGNLLRTVWKNGEFLVNTTFKEIRDRAALK